MSETAEQAAVYALEIMRLQKELNEARRDAERYREFREVAMKYFIADAMLEEREK